jgi:hypothetical protein
MHDFLPPVEPNRQPAETSWPRDRWLTIMVSLQARPNHIFIEHMVIDPTKAVLAVNYPAIEPPGWKIYLLPRPIPARHS